MRGYLGKYPPDAYDEADWLCFDEQRLLALTSGEVFQDEVGLTALRRQLAVYPDAVWRDLLASQWANLAQEQAFIQRTAQTGDDLGSRILAARTAERLMRLALSLIHISLGQRRGALYRYRGMHPSAADDQPGGH